MSSLFRTATEAKSYGTTAKNKELLRSHGKQFVSVSGSYQERYEIAVRAVESMLS